MEKYPYFRKLIKENPEFNPDTIPRTHSVEGSGILGFLKEAWNFIYSSFNVMDVVAQSLLALLAWITLPPGIGLSIIDKYSILRAVLGWTNIFAWTIQWIRFPWLSSTKVLKEITPEMKQLRDLICSELRIKDANGLQLIPEDTIDELLIGNPEVEEIVKRIISKLAKTEADKRKIQEDYNNLQEEIRQKNVRIQELEQQADELEAQITEKNVLIENMYNQTAVLENTNNDLEVQLTFVVAEIEKEKQQHLIELEDMHKSNAVLDEIIKRYEEIVQNSNIPKGREIVNNMREDRLKSIRNLKRKREDHINEPNNKNPAINTAQGFFNSFPSHTQIPIPYDPHEDTTDYNSIPYVYPTRVINTGQFIRRVKPNFAKGFNKGSALRAYGFPKNEVFGNTLNEYSQRGDLKKDSNSGGWFLKNLASTVAKQAINALI